MEQTLRVLDIGQVRTCEFHTDPFAYGVMRSIVKPEFRSRLLNAFPETGFSETVRTSGAKPYRMYHRPLVNETAGSVPLLEGLDDVWVALYEDLSSDLYRNVISQVTGQNLSDCHLGASFWRYDSDCFLSVHTDKPEKVVTHLLYLSEEWDETWGGCLHLHEDTPEKSVFRTIRPVLDNSPLLVTSEQSWHSVGPVLEGQRHRRSLQIVFWRA